MASKTKPAGIEGSLPQYGLFITASFCIKVLAAELSDKIAEMLRTSFIMLIAELSDRISNHLAPVSEQLQANQDTFNKLDNDFCSLPRQVAEKKLALS